MANNHSKLLGQYDELLSFLAQIDVYRGRVSLIPMICQHSFPSTLESLGHVQLAGIVTD